MSRTISIDSASSVSKTPPLIIDAADYNRLTGLVLRQKRGAEAVKQLLDEIERAELKRTEDIPSDVVTIGADVTFMDSRMGRPQTIRLSFPEHADVREGRVSILTPIGAALIGLSVGQSIEWIMPDGSTRELAVLSVIQRRHREEQA